MTEKKVSQEASAEYGGNLFALLTFNVPLLFISFFSILLLLPFLTSAEYGGNLLVLLDKNLVHRITVNFDIKFTKFEQN